MTQRLWVRSPPKYVGQRWKMKMAVNLTEEGLATNNEWRLIMSHKWNTSKKSSLEAWILDEYQAFHVLLISQTYSMRIRTSISVPRGLSSHYDTNNSSKYLVGVELGDAERRKHDCHNNGAQTKSIQLMWQQFPYGSLKTERRSSYKYEFRVVEYQDTRLLLFCVMLLTLRHQN